MENSLLNGTNSSEVISDFHTTQDCTNDYCISDEDYLAMVEDYIFPNTFEWVIVFVYAVTFIIGVSGNVLLFASVWKNRVMQTVTNILIINLAAADLAVIFVCLPATLIADVTETWFMGRAMCKLTLFLMTTTVAVSVLTLCAIAVERWYHICRPVRLNSDVIHAKVIIVYIWVSSGCIAVPELLVAELFPTFPEDMTHLLTSCMPGWRPESQTIYQVFLFLTLYVLPLGVMTLLYVRIASVLWGKDTVLEEETDAHAVRSDTTTTDNTLKVRRKAAVMLMTVVASFAICFFPVHLLNILRYTRTLYELDVEMVSHIALCCHWLPYVNSTLHPIIYGLMCAKFRRYFKNTCNCMVPCFSKANIEIEGIEMNHCTDAQHDILDTEAEHMRTGISRLMSLELLNSHETNDITPISIVVICCIYAAQPNLYVEAICTAIPIFILLYKGHS
ncbi:hypothetical protein ScPMuIL_006035 [Solemya velum]